LGSGINRWSSPHRLAGPETQQCAAKLPAVGQALEFCRGLQLPVLAAGLYVATGQATAPVAFVEVAVQTKASWTNGPAKSSWTF
jgi:hypothetical protein